MTKPPCPKSRRTSFFPCFRLLRSGRFGILTYFGALLLAGGVGSARGDAPNGGETDAPWLDTSNRPINAHGGGMLYYQGTYYWYGEDKTGLSWVPDGNKSWDGYRVDVTGIHCYSSPDLTHWKDEGLVLKAVTDNPASDLHPSKVCERPKVIYNSTTQKFVMWMHVDSADYKLGKAGVAVADRPTGPFTYLGSVNPEGRDSRDQTLFQDDDGKAYRIYASEGNRATYISLLTDDYLKHSGKFVRIFENDPMEAQCVFKHGGKYWLVGSHVTGWQPNPARAAVADSIWGSWKKLGNPCSGPGSSNTFGAQPACVFPVAGHPDTFIFMADRWNKLNLSDSQYVWQPVKFAASGIEVAWQDSWPLGSLSESGAAVGKMAGTGLRERICIRSDWRFARQDPAASNPHLGYADLRPWILAARGEFVPGFKSGSGNACTNTPTFAESQFDDRQWRPLNLPHDWGIEGQFKQEYPGATGKLPYWGVGWYRKHLTIPAADEGNKISLDVDGAMSYASVWMNGKFVGGWPYGYASWRVDLTPFVKYGADNVIAIRLENPKESSRWYPGGGIYRNVWLVKTAPIHVAHWGTVVSTPRVEKESATVKIDVTVDNDTDAETSVTLKSIIFELQPDCRKGQSVAVMPPQKLSLPPRQSLTAANQAELKDPRWWSLENPQRYVVVTTVERNGGSVDDCETPFGIRTARFSADQGFFLNGRRVPIHGVCNHHDLGALGTAINPRALERQLELLKTMGCNAIRTSHNPPAPELLDLCDRMGFLVMDEAFDCWKKGKTKNDYSRLFDDWHEADLRALVRRDRNHPCVVLWSIGNEVPDQGTAEGPRLAAELRGIVHSEDDTRPVTSACDKIGSGFNGFRKGVDVFGYNYKPFLYAQFHRTNTAQPLIGSETASTISSRGEYFFPVSTNRETGKTDFQVSSYDLTAPNWATLPDREFAAQDKNPCVAGEFVWTGFDYLGEPTPYDFDATNLPSFSDPSAATNARQELATTGKVRVPSRSSYFGILDLAGFPKDRFYLYQSRWRSELPLAHILPHWNWPGREGLTTPVQVYTSGDAAELFLNGQSLGLKKKGADEYRLRWDDAVYQPGELKVVAYKNGQVWASDSVKTTGPAAKLALEPDRTPIRADGQDLAFVTVNIVDQDGLLVPRSNNEIRFTIAGPGDLVGMDNGDATSHESFQGTHHTAFNGKALAIVCSKPGLSGVITLRAESEGLGVAEVKIQVH